MGAPGFPSHPCQAPEREAGLMQLHFTARIHQHAAKHMSENQRHTVQLGAQVSPKQMANRMQTSTSLDPSLLSAL